MSASEYEVLTAWIDATFTSKERAAKGLTKIVILDTTDSDDNHLLKDENGQPIPWEKMAESLRKKYPRPIKNHVSASLPFKRKASWYAFSAPGQLPKAASIIPRAVKAL